MSVHFLPERLKADNDLLLGLRLAFGSLREEKKEEIISYINSRKFELSSVFLEWFQVVTKLPSHDLVEQVNSANEKEEQ